MPEEELRSYNALNITCFSNYETLKKSWADFGSWSKAWRKFQASSAVDEAQEWRKLKENRVSLILESEPGFPEQLREIPWPPFGLYIKGELLINTNPLVAIVGTRKATEHGKTLAKKFARLLSATGITIVSGLEIGRAHV